MNKLKLSLFNNEQNKNDIFKLIESSDNKFKNKVGIYTKSKLWSLTFGLPIFSAIIMLMTVANFSLSEIALLDSRILIMELLVTPLLMFIIYTMLNFKNNRIKEIIANVINLKIKNYENDDIFIEKSREFIWRTNLYTEFRNKNYRVENLIFETNKLINNNDLFKVNLDKSLNFQIITSKLSDYYKDKLKEILNYLHNTEPNNFHDYVYNYLNKSIDKKLILSDKQVDSLFDEFMLFKNIHYRIIDELITLKEENFKLKSEYDLGIDFLTNSNILSDNIVNRYTNYKNYDNLLEIEIELKDLINNIKMENKYLSHVINLKNEIKENINTYGLYKLNHICDEYYSRFKNKNSVDFLYSYKFGRLLSDTQYLITYDSINDSLKKKSEPIINYYYENIANNIINFDNSDRAYEDSCHLHVYFYLHVFEYMNNISEDLLYLNKLMNDNKRIISEYYEDNNYLVDIIKNINDDNNYKKRELFFKNIYSKIKINKHKHNRIILEIEMIEKIENILDSINSYDFKKSIKNKIKIALNIPSDEVKITVLNNIYEYDVKKKYLERN